MLGRGPPWIDRSRRATSPAAELAAAAAATGRHDIDTLSRTAPIGPLDRRTLPVASCDPRRMDQSTKQERSVMVLNHNCPTD